MRPTGYLTYMLITVALVEVTGHLPQSFHRMFVALSPELRAEVYPGGF